VVAGLAGHGRGGDAANMPRVDERTRRGEHRAGMTDAASVVRQYYAVVADLDGSADALRALLHPEVQITEHPNAITPAGAVRDRDTTIAGYLAGKQLLAQQAFDVLELIVDGSRVAVRATWQGTLARDLGPLPAGTVMTARVAAFLTVLDGQIREHDTFDCYEPFAGPG
jgi:ketosteroid isomerase-like protein